MVSYLTSTKDGAFLAIPFHHFRGTRDKAPGPPEVERAPRFNANRDMVHSAATTRNAVADNTSGKGEENEQLHEFPPVLVQEAQCHWEPSQMAAWTVAAAVSRSKDTAAILEGSVPSRV